MIPEGADPRVEDEDEADEHHGRRALARLRAELREIQLLLDGLRARLPDAGDPRGGGGPDDDRPGRPER